MSALAGRLRALVIGVLLCASGGRVTEAAPGNELDVRCDAREIEGVSKAVLEVVNRSNRAVTTSVVIVVFDRRGRAWYSRPLSRTLEVGERYSRSTAPPRGVGTIARCDARWQVTWRGAAQPARVERLDLSEGPAPGDKSEGSAFMLSAGITASALPLLLLADGFSEKESEGAARLFMAAGVMALLAGPSAGHWYAHRPTNAGQWLRAGGLLVAVTALSVDPPCLWDCGSGDREYGLVVALAGMGVHIYGALYEIGTAHKAARAYNRRRRIRLMPGAVSTSGGPRPGLVIGGAW